MLLEQNKIQDQELEAVVLGAVMLDKSAIMAAMESLISADCFSDEFHHRVWICCLDLFEQGDPIDIMTVTNLYRQKYNEMKAYEISTLTSRVSSAANVSHHCRILSQMYLKRHLSEITFELWQNSTDESTDVFDVLDQAVTKINKVSGTLISSDSRDIDKITGKVLEDLRRAMDNKGEITGISTGFPQLDRNINGLQRSDLIYLAARPSMGKTAFFLSILANQIDQGISALVFSLEMSAEQLTQRLISQMSGVPLMQIRRGMITDNEMQMIQEATDKINSSKIKVIDRAFNMRQIKSHISKHVKSNGIDVVFVDYLQLMEGDRRSSREQQVSQISRSLKLSAKEFDCPIICLSQLSRAVEQRGGAKKPLLSDLRESGSIEQDADQVFFLYRPDYYGFTQDADGNQIPDGYTELICSKNRNGQLFIYDMLFRKDLTLFEEFNAF